MAFCGVCGTENRDKARFCIGCAKALVPLGDSAPTDAEALAAAPAASAPGPVQICPACQIANPLAATVCKSCRGSLVPDLAKPMPPPDPPARRGAASRVAVGLALGVVAVGVWWFGVKEGAGNPSTLAGVPALSQAGSPDAQPVRVGTAVTLSTTAAPPPGESSVAAQTERSALEKAAGEDTRIKRQAAANARREQAARDRAAAEEQARTAKAQEQQRAEEALRQKAAAEAAQLARATRPPPAPPAPVVKTVEQTCASSGNFFSREVCRLRSCGSPAFASDPVCVRFREMEAANRQAVTN